MTSPPAVDPLGQLFELLADRLADLLHERQQLRPEPELSHGGTSPWMSIDTAATYLDWPRQRLYKLTAQGAIPHYKHDGRLLFHRQELDLWLAGHRQPGDWMNGENRAISP